MNNNTKYSIQDITERKNNKKSELSASKKKIQELTQNHFNTGMAAYDGIMTGVKIYKRLRAVFSRKKYNKT